MDTKGETKMKRKKEVTKIKQQEEMREGKKDPRVLDSWKNTL